MNKLTTNARRLGILFRILTVVLTAGLIIAAVGVAVLTGMLLFGLPADSMNGYFTYTSGILTLAIAPEYVPEPRAVILQIIFNLLAGIVLMFTARRCMFHIRRILKQMENGEPFAEAVGESFKKLSVLTLAGGVILNVLTFVNEAIIIAGYRLPELLISEKITHVTVTHTFEFNFLVTAAVLYLASLVFSYGAQLQQLSDETL